MSVFGSKTLILAFYAFSEAQISKFFPVGMLPEPPDL